MNCKLSRANRWWLRFLNFRIPLTWMFRDKWLFREEILVSPLGRRVLCSSNTLFGKLVCAIERPTRIVLIPSYVLRKQRLSKLVRM